MILVPALFEIVIAALFEILAVLLKIVVAVFEIVAALFEIVSYALFDMLLGEMSLMSPVPKLLRVRLA